MTVISIRSSKYNIVAGFDAVRKIYSTIDDATLFISLPYPYLTDTWYNQKILWYKNPVILVYLMVL